MPQGLSGAVGGGSAGWSAELRIDAARLGDWNRLTRLYVAHGDSAAWPQAGNATSPRTWGRTALGTLPSYTIYLPAIQRAAPTT